LTPNWALECVDEIGSTQSELMRRAKLKTDDLFRSGETLNSSLSAQALMARAQTAGKGRSGKTWHSPASGDNLYLSMLLPIAKPISELSGLSLVFGLAARRAIASASLEVSRERHDRLVSPNVGKVALKWPNDLQIDGKKIGGILVEIASHTSLQTWVVAGIGVNIAMPTGAPIDQAYSSLHAHQITISARDLAHVICTQWWNVAAEFSAQGFAGFAQEFQQADALLGHEVFLNDAPEQIWIASGVDASGALCLQRGSELKHLQAGEVSVRRALERTLAC
jgi:BirA family transcriptional regulator, biotin operon repressor / biotin---[acetyl-CoA-carboxylase] ligase